MTRVSLLALIVCLAGYTAAAQTSPVGSWRAELDLGQMALPLVIHVTQEGAGLASTLDSPDQGAFGIPTTSTVVRNDSLLIDVGAIQARMVLLIAPDSLRGRFSQAGQEFPVVFGPTEAALRPQEPVGPLPYATREVQVESAPGVTLAGTVVIPEGTGPFPAVVFVSGSGPQDRDESLAGHRPFAVWADFLAKAGIASVRFDDRGAGASTGDFSVATLDDLLEDARAAVRFAKGVAEFARVGIVGHSEGGYTALRLQDEAAFLVTVAGPSVSGAEVYAEQTGALARVSGVDSTAATVFSAAIRAALQPMLADPTAPSDSLRSDVERAFNQALIPMPTGERLKLGLSGPSYTQVRAAIADFILSPGFRSFALFDPANAMSTLRTPTLALYGAKDVQVLARQNVGPMEAALANVPNSKVLVFDSANHLFQEATTGSVIEYGQIEQTVNPAVMESITSWIQSVAGAR